MTSETDTVAEYLDELEPERRKVVSRALDFVRTHIPEGYAETMQYGMISWAIPLERYAYTYNGEPLSVVSLASQKRHVALYLHGVYADAEVAAALRSGYESAGRKLDMGKSCLRFRRWDDVVPDVLAKALEAVPPARFIARYEEGQGPERMEKHRKAAQKRATEERKSK